MKAALALLALLTATVNALAGGSFAGNGGGISEKNLIFAMSNLDRYIDVCIDTDLCKVTDPEKQLLVKIRAALPRERATQLQFLSGQTHHDFFVLDGQIRVAKTGNNVGDPIFINTDLIYMKYGANQYQPTDVPLGISILVHELGHHQGITDHDWLDRLGTKLQTFFLKQTERSEIWNGDITFTVIQSNVVHSDDDKKHLHAVDQVTVAFDDQVLELTSRILTATRCPDGVSRPQGLRLYNLHEDRGVRYDARLDLSFKPLTLWYVMSCRAGEVSDVGNVEFTLALKRKPITNQPDLDLTRSQFIQKSCKKDVSVCK